MKILLFPEDVNVTILKLLVYIVILLFTILAFGKGFLLVWLFKIYCLIYCQEFFQGKEGWTLSHTLTNKIPVSIKIKSTF